MKRLPGPQNAPTGTRGAALLLSFMVLLILILILAQIRYSTDTAARVARNEETLISMNHAIES
jgi:Tfp pilus assembly protein PilX